MYHPELLEEGLEPHTVKEVYLAGAVHPDRWIDITDVFERKLAAIRCHVSQVREPEALEERIRERDKSVDIYGREVLHEAFNNMIIG
jgi:LmbE family N-acetylglucosaminyl deacetylase